MRRRMRRRRRRRRNESDGSVVTRLPPLTPVHTTQSEE